VVTKTQISGGIRDWSIELQRALNEEKSGAKKVGGFSNHLGSFLVIFTDFETSGSADMQNKASEYG